MDVYLINKNHEHIFRMYNELKQILPNGFLKMKVLKNQKYHLSGNGSLINEIENTLHNNCLIKNISSSQNINIYYSEKDKPKQLPNINNKMNKYNSEINIFNSQNLIDEPNTRNDNSIENIKTNEQNETNYYNGEKFDKENNNKKNNIELTNSIKSIRDKNLRSLGLINYRAKRIKGVYNSSPISDIEMKKNIYLPKIIDRMKYNLPRNQRQIEGFIVTGHNGQSLLYKPQENKNLYIQMPKQNSNDSTLKNNNNSANKYVDKTNN